MDTGRKKYEIVKAGNQKSRSSPLKFFWHKMQRWVTFNWKGPKGGRKSFIRVNPNSGDVDFVRGARFTEAVAHAVEAMIEDRRAKIDAKIASIPIP
jgi:hypothetical protein